MEAVRDPGINGTPSGVVIESLRMSTYLVIFGAAVQADGSPSGTLRRRVEGALAAGKAIPDACYLPTGAGASGFVEAEVIRGLLLKSGVAAQAIVTECSARDTLESVRYCDAILRDRGDADIVIPCTSRYHIARCVALLRLMGWRVRTVRMPSDFGAVPLVTLIWYYLKELVALPYDCCLILAGRNKW
jgi:uncharacterized SAM-binding protein YcdF (DUF218 family)